MVEEFAVNLWHVFRRVFPAAYRTLMRFLVERQRGNWETITCWGRITEGMGTAEEDTELLLRMFLTKFPENLAPARAVVMREDAES